MKIILQADKIRIVILISLIFFIYLSPAISQTSFLNSEYIVYIQQKINQYLTYPPEATINGWEGIVKIRFVIGQNGQTKEFNIVKSSGYPLLDESAMSATKKASPYPFPENFPGKELELIIPVRFVKSEMPQETMPKTIRIGPPFISQESAPLPQKKAKAKQLKDKTLPTGEASSRQPELLLKEAIQPPFEIAQPQLPPSESWVKTPESSTTNELTKFIKLALKNHRPTKLAKEESEMAQLKVKEANRNFFPGVKLQAYNSDGEVYKLKYTERELKAGIEQPLYYSGRLKDTLNQAQVNLKITQSNYDRVKIDVLHKTEVAYYNLTAAQIHLREKETIQSKAQEILERIEKLAASDMIIPLEVNSARNWLKQIKFQAESVKQELVMAQLTFKQVLNTAEIPPIEAQQIEVKKPHLNLKDCVAIAVKHRPEIYLGKLMVKFTDYGKKIESAKNKLSLDFVGSLGYYQGGYETEKMSPSNNWYGGFKVTQPLGASTLNSSYTSDSSQPRFGQTSPTKANTLSGEFSFLDNINRVTEQKKSSIELHRAMNDSDETVKTVTFEVQDAFLNYKKALFQMDTAETEMQFRLNEIGVTKIRAMVGETSFSNILEALYVFSEAETKYIQALANYRISLANLKKACGYGLEI